MRGARALKMLTDTDLARYCARLGLDTLPPATPEGLARLQSAQLGSLPFEGIEPFLGHTPSLAPSDIAAKILHRGRGGYCYELNTLFGAAMTAAGFDARRALARVLQRNPEPGARSHLAWIVRIGDSRWLADTGFGGPGARTPIEIRPGEQAAANGTYRMTRNETLGEDVLERLTSDGWQKLYSFDGASVTDAEVEAANHVAATWRNSVFPWNLMVAGFDGDTRIGVFNRNLTEETPDALSRHDIADAAALGRVFDRIGLQAAPDLLDRVWQRLENPLPVPA
ncbi:MAG: arylamine N-acetyltransferase [Maritimibacter sp.]|nr:arylamine N-acetyltransferase [Maritimibacter sp.]